MSRQLRLASSNSRQPAHNRSHLHKRILSRALSVRIVVRARCNSRAPVDSVRADAAVSFAAGKIWFMCRSRRICEGKREREQ